MGTSTEQALEAVAATRGRIEARVNRIEGRVRQDLDPRRRLRRDGPKLVVGGVVVVLIGTVYVIRSRRRHRAESEAEVDWIAAMPEQWRARLQELISEAATSGRVPAAAQDKRGKRPLVLSIGLRAARMAAPMVISAAAERINRRSGAGAHPGPRAHS